MFITSEHSSIFFWHANVLTPSIFIAQEPQTPSLQDFLKVKLGSNSAFIWFKISKTIVPAFFTSISNLSIWGGVFSSPDQRYTLITRISWFCWDCSSNKSTLEYDFPFMGTEFLGSESWTINKLLLAVG